MTTMMDDGASRRRMRSRTSSRSDNEADRTASTSPSSPSSASPPIPFPLTPHSLARFKRLPPEILSEIFVRCLPEKTSFDPLLAPTVLTHVCHDWRTIALNSPRLWSMIIVPDWQSLPSGLLDLFKLWVARAGEAPLDVEIGMFDEDVMVLPESHTAQELFALMRRMLEAIGPHRKSIRRFRGVFPVQLTQATGVGEMTNAEMISYCGMLGDGQTFDFNDERIVDDDEILDIGPRRESLKSLAICGCAARLSSVMLQTQLTHIELLDLHKNENLCQKRAFELMSSLTQLKTCVLDLSKHEPEDWVGPEERIVLPNIELLFLTWSFPADIAQLLSSISTPSLEKLGLRGTPMVGRNQWSGLYDFLRASKPPLKRISIGDFASVDCRYLDVFTLCTELEHLTMNHCELPDELFRRLSVTDGTAEGTLLPNLQIFNIGVCEGFELESLTTFLKARSRTETEEVAKLREAAIMYCMEVRERNVEELEAIGMENLILEPIDNEATFPFARVIETHRDLIAMLFKNDEEGDEDPPFSEFPDDEETLVGNQGDVGDALDEAEAQGEDGMDVDGITDEEANGGDVRD